MTSMWCTVGSAVRTIAVVPLVAMLLVGAIGCSQSEDGRDPAPTSATTTTPLTTTTTQITTTTVTTTSAAPSIVETSAVPSVAPSSDTEHVVQPPPSDGGRPVPVPGGSPENSGPWEQYMPAMTPFSSCAAARAAGAAPLHRGEPGYSPNLDRDGDGVACEAG
ncbi:excalibur calcium-binding domain-containing protein [Mycolicibacterium alvei]|nr:excalibur calcium-binding domain-containing protein [Mycolicibacterium alvei]